VAPFLVRRPAHVVAACLLLPLAASWTIGRDRALDWGSGPRERAVAGARFRREIDAVGVVPGELRTAGHFDSPLLLAMQLLPPGDEIGRRPWSSRWVLHEVFEWLPIDAGYSERARLVLPFKTFVLRERTGERR
jgi:hypothetical protein